ncbi:MAG: endonuclease/exonuclease/phosphatase family protein [Myxococcota bacterium]
MARVGYSPAVAKSLAGRMRIAVAVLCGLYVVGTVVAVGLLFGLADVHWAPTVLAFGPRWPLLVPGLLCLPLALATRRWKWAIATGAALLATAGPYMGFAASWAAAAPSADASDDVPAGGALRFATFNLQGRDVLEPYVAQKLKALDADVVALTECEGEQHRGDLAGYHTVNIYGLCLFSRLPVLASHARDPKDAWAREGSGVVLHAELDHGGTPIHVVGLHLATVRGGLTSLRYGEIEGMNENIELRRWESEVVRGYVDAQVPPGAPLVVLGDFNLPVESEIFRRSWGDLSDTWRRCGLGYGHTKRTRWFGVRIDHVLTNDAWRCSDIEVGDGRGSDHDPVIATLTRDG